MKVSVDPKKCLGCGACAATCPEVFELKGKVAKVKVKETNKPCAKEAAENCPTQAITVK